MRRRKRKNDEIYGVVGLGRFGFNLAKTLCESGKDVIVVDNDPKKIKEISEYTENAFLIDELNMNSLTEAGISNCDTVIVGIGETIDVGILATLNVIQLGVKKVIAKAITPEQGTVLEKIGAEVLYPEKDMAVRLAKRLTSPQTMEYISLSDEIDITEIVLTDRFKEMTVAQLDIRKRFSLNIIAIKHGEDIITEITPTTVLYPNDNLVVIGKNTNIELFENSIA
jgi:trk system potassium uptake protein TrkA